MEWLTSTLLVTANAVADYCTEVVVVVVVVVVVADRRVIDVEMVDDDDDVFECVLMT